MTEKRKPILCIDFDATIHKYRKGWQNGEIYDDVTDGFFEWAMEARLHFALVIYSSRSKTLEGRQAMAAWLQAQAEAYYGDEIVATDCARSFEFAHEKPPAFLTIDDRAIAFKGDWLAGELSPAVMMNYRTWTQT